VTAPHDDSHLRRPAAATAEEIVDAEVEVEAGAAERVIAFSDAVVAIAITLLALGLTVPLHTTDRTSNGQLIDALRGEWPAYLAFLISFAVIGRHWATHRRVFRYVTRLNPVVGRLNMLWLLMMVLTPFAANLLAGQGGFGVRFSIYALIQVIATGCLMLMSRAIVHANLLRPNAPARARHPDYLPYIGISIAFLVSIPVAFVSHWAYALWASAPLLTRLLRRVTANGRHVTSDATQEFGARSPWME
jgi:TMEM175 potassium channel family protein